MKPFYLITNEDLEGWDVVERDGIKTEEGNEDSVVATFFDKPIALQYVDKLNEEALTAPADWTIPQIEKGDRVMLLKDLTVKVHNPDTPDRVFPKGTVLSVTDVGQRYRLPFVSPEGVGHEVQLQPRTYDKYEVPEHKKIVEDYCYINQTCVVQIDGQYFGYDGSNPYPEALFDDINKAYPFSNSVHAYATIHWHGGKVFRIVPAPKDMEKN